MFGFESIAKSVESVAKEWIETSGEKAEANALMVKTLDPNGLMRRDISSKISTMYIVYISVMMFLVIVQAFGIEPENVSAAIANLTDLFVPITTMFTAIVGASFGVNGLNATKGK
jgi:hypothetical protein